MNYNIVKNDIMKGRVLLKRTHTLQRVLTIILFLIGGFMLPAGILLFFAEDAGSSAPFLVTGIGLLMVTGGFMLATQLKIPEYLIFDNSAGLFKIIENRGDKVEFAAFPYSEIAGFHTRVHRSDNSVSYAVEMEKKDGAFWTLFSSMKEKKAGEFQGELAKYVTLGSQGPAEVTGRDDGDFEVIDQGDTSTVSWKKRYPFTSYLFGAMAIASMALTIYGIGSQTENIIGYYIAVAFISFISIFFILNIIISTGRRYVIEISRDTFKFFTKGGIYKGKGFSLPVIDIQAILFNFSTSEMENTIYILRREEMELLQKVKRGTIGLDEIAKALSLMLKIKKLDAGSLLIRDKIALENILQREIAKKSGRTGL